MIISHDVHLNVKKLYLYIYSASFVKQKRFGWKTLWTTALFIINCPRAHLAGDLYIEKITFCLRAESHLPAEASAAAAEQPIDSPLIKRLPSSSFIQTGNPSTLFLWSLHLLSSHAAPPSPWPGSTSPPLPPPPLLWWPTDADGGGGERGKGEFRP